MRIVISRKDLRRDVFCAGGPGGQHQNKVATAVRFTYLPLGIAAECRETRSQSVNSERALDLLKQRIKAHYEREREAQQGSIKKKASAFGSQKRSYVLCGERRVVDHETGVKADPHEVLNGDLDRFINAQVVVA